MVTTRWVSAASAVVSTQAHRGGGESTHRLSRPATELWLQGEKGRKIGVDMPGAGRAGQV